MPPQTSRHPRRTGWYVPSDGLKFRSVEKNDGYEAGNGGARAIGKSAANEALSLAAAWLRMGRELRRHRQAHACERPAEHANGKVAFAAYTGRAAGVMRQKGCKNLPHHPLTIYSSDIDPVTGDVDSTLPPTRSS